MIAWHESVRKKYNNICQGCKRWFPENMCCGHHIKSKKAYPELKYDVENGLLVCLKDHNDIHNGNLKVIGENGEYEVIDNRSKKE